VTAQRRAESAQEVPIPLATITPDAALNAGAVSTDNFAEHVIVGYLDTVAVIGGRPFACSTLLASVRRAENCH
jgi:hypothetical protein